MCLVEKVGEPIEKPASALDQSAAQHGQFFVPRVSGSWRDGLPASELLKQRVLLL